MRLLCPKFTGARPGAFQQRAGGATVWIGLLAGVLLSLWLSPAWAGSFRAAGGWPEPSHPLDFQAAPPPVRFSDGAFPWLSVNLSPPAEATRTIPKAWQDLADKLLADGFDPDYLAGVFQALGDSVSTLPMGSKVQELYRNKMRQSSTAGGQAEEKEPDAESIARGALPGITPGVLTAANMAKARAFLREHAQAFQTMEELYGVEPEIGVALLLMETALGDYLGNAAAVANLASMAACREPEAMRPYLKGYAFNATVVAWLEEVMPKRADWAYQELSALLAYGSASGQDILKMPGSIYGALGLCQFMPSNIDAYGVDATGKGYVDLFTVPDALYSLANYLKEHGWSADLDQAQKHAVLLRYNHSARYANTIITVAEYLKSPPGSPLPAAAYQPGKTYRYTPPTTPVKPSPLEDGSRSYGNVPLP